MSSSFSRLRTFAFASILLLSAYLSRAQTASQEWPALGKNELESVWLEGAPVVGYNNNPNTVTLFTFLDNCQTRSQEDRNPSAEWVRLAYHDSATHNVNGDGLGGLDQSIRFELDRAENVGSGMSRTMSELGRVAGSKQVSFADLIAVGVVQAAASCGGPLVPFRGGRIDATEAGPDGVPAPSQTLEEHTESFRKQGFSPTEMIELVACGHTIGGVRSPDFPEIVPPRDPEDPFDLTVQSFDSTSGFDNAVVREYLDGATRNPLVIHPNKNITSDLRIFVSDGNKTMEALSDPATFEARCGVVFEKMINTVPQSVELGPVFEPIKVKVGRSFLTVNTTLGLQTDIRFLTANPSRQVTLKWQSRQNSETHSASPLYVTENTNHLARRLGHPNIVHYWFNPRIDAAASVSKFWFEVDEGSGGDVDVYDNNGQGYSIEQDAVVYAPALSERHVVPFGTKFVVAVRDTQGPVTSVTGDCLFLDTFGTTIDIPRNIDFTLDTALAPVEGFALYSTFIADEGTFVDRFFCDVTASINGNSAVEKDISKFYITRTIFPF